MSEIKYVGMDLAKPGSEETILSIRGGYQQRGKNAALAKYVDDFIRKNPETTIVFIGPDGMRIEKHVKELGPLRLT